MSVAMQKARDVIAEALFYEERNAAMGFDCWPETFDGMGEVGVLAYRERADAILAALVEQMELREQPIRAEWPHMAHDTAARLVTDWQGGEG